MKNDSPKWEPEFDRFAEEYRSQHAANIALSGETPDFFAEYKVADIAGVLRDRQLYREGLRVLDFGAGIGNSVPFLRTHLPHAEITCLDVSDKSLDLGRARFGGAADFVHFAGGDLPFPDESFDVVLCACVLHHIPHSEHEAILAHLRRVLSKGGLLFVFEHNPLNPLTVQAVNTCPFDENAELIYPWSLSSTLGRAGYSAVETRFRIFFPNLLRRLRRIEKYLRWCPVGAQYSMIAQR